MTKFDELINAAREHIAERIETIKGDKYDFYSEEDLQNAEAERQKIEAQAAALEAIAAQELRTVTIPAREEHGGTESVTLTLPWRCIHCGGARGEPAEGTSWDGSCRLAVHTWTNPCGHTEYYSEVRKWAVAN